MAEGVVVEVYIVRGAHNSRLAVSNLEAWMRARFGQRPPRVDLIEVFDEPGRALAAGVWLTPQVVARGARGEARLVGTLEDPVALEHVLMPVFDVAT